MNTLRLSVRTSNEKKFSVLPVADDIQGYRFIVYVVANKWGCTIQYVKEWWVSKRRPRFPTKSALSTKLKTEKLLLTVWPSSCTEHLLLLDNNQPNSNTSTILALIGFQLFWFLQDQGLLNPQSLGDAFECFVFAEATSKWPAFSWHVRSHTQKCFNCAEPYVRKRTGSWQSISKAEAFIRSWRKLES